MGTSQASSYGEWFSNKALCRYMLGLRLVDETRFKPSGTVKGRSCEFPMLVLSYNIWPISHPLDMIQSSWLGCTLTHIIHPSPLLSLSLLTLPIPHMTTNNCRRLLRTMLPPYRLHKIPLWIHQVKVDAMIYQVILSLLHALGRGKVNPIRLTHAFDLFPCSCETDNIGVKLGQVFL